MSPFLISEESQPTHKPATPASPRLWSPSAPAAEDSAAAAVIAKQDIADTPVEIKASTEYTDSQGTPTKSRYSLTIKELPMDERPRERLWKYGPQALSTAELIAVLIRVGTDERSAVSLGEHLIAEFGNIKEIAGASLDQLSKIKGIGKAKAAEIQAAIEFGHRLALFADEGRHAITSPRDGANLLMPELRYLKKETLKSILLDTKNRVIAIKTVSIGDLSSSIVHPREVFKDAVIASAASLLVAHNHPSGDPTPSAEDINITKRLMQAGEIMGIDLLDHLVIGDGTWVSLKERGLV